MYCHIGTTYFLISIHALREEGDFIPPQFFKIQ